MTQAQPAAIRADYTIEEAAGIFACGQKTVSNWIRAGKIKAYRLGGNGHWRIPYTEVDRLRAEWMSTGINEDDIEF